MTRAQVSKMLDAANVRCDKFSVKKDGTIEMFRAYFYRHGSTAEGFGEGLAKKLPALRLVNTEDRWAAWPKTSYFVAIFQPASTPLGGA